MVAALLREAGKSPPPCRATLDVACWDRIIRKWTESQDPKVTGLRKGSSDPLWTLHECGVSFSCATPLKCRGLLVTTAQPSLGCLVRPVSLEMVLHVAKDNQIKSDISIFVQYMCMQVKQKQDRKGHVRECSQSWSALGLQVTALSYGFYYLQFLPSPQHINLFYLLNSKVNEVTFKYIYIFHYPNYLEFRGKEKLFWFLCL